MTTNSFEIETDALIQNLEQVNDFIHSHLETVECPLKAQMQIDIAVEEIFANIAHYAYAPGTGKARIGLSLTDEPVVLTITFADRGVPYNPLERKDPDVTLSAQERGIGGLGIYMTKKSMDDVAYEYRDGQNILTLKKRLNPVGKA